MFVTSANDAYALDAQTGRTIWHYSRPITEGLIDDASQHHNRGVGVWRHTSSWKPTMRTCFVSTHAPVIYFGMSPYTDGNPNYGATSAPLVVKDKVIVGTSGGDDGIRGFIAAYDAETGKEAWRFWTIPGPGEIGSASWPGECYLLGGGTTWMPGTYDPELNTIFWGTSNPAPDFDGGPRRATISTPIASWPSIPTPASSNGISSSRRTTCTTMTPPKLPCWWKHFQRSAAKTALYKRTAMAFCTSSIAAMASSSRPDHSWKNSIGPAQLTIRAALFAPDFSQPTEGTRVCPGFAGATNWYSPSYNPATIPLLFHGPEDLRHFLFASLRNSSPARPIIRPVRIAAQGTTTKKSCWPYALDGDKPAWRYPSGRRGPLRRGHHDDRRRSGFLRRRYASPSKPWTPDRQAVVAFQHRVKTITASPMTYAVNSETVRGYRRRKRRFQFCFAMNSKVRKRFE